MARLHEYQGKALLAKAGLPVPRGSPASTPHEAADAAKRLLSEGAAAVVVKIQAWTTGRAAIGGVAFGSTPDEARAHAQRMLAMRVGQFPVEQVLVEEKLDIAPGGEFFVSLSIDDKLRAPILLISLSGGSGVEERARQVHRVPCDVIKGPDQAELERIFAPAGPRAADLARAARTVFDVARANEARSVEVNPLVVTRDGRILAADCRITIDDYAASRHPDLGIDIARELDHPPTALERIAYAAEQADHRGTFYFAQLATEPAPGSKGLIGFHGAGGGGSMMSMDAITAEGFTIANFTDTSGNPSAAKVYRAARIILSQPGLVGYFGSGSGVASQEQFWSAYGLAKAFWEVNLDIPAVIRLGGNSEDRAVEILQDACRDLPTTVEGYKKTDPPKKIAARFATLVAEAGGKRWEPRPPSQLRRPAFVGSPSAASFPIRGGRVWIDAARWRDIAPAVIARSSGLLHDAGGRPEPTLSPEELAGKDSEFIACEVECRRIGIDGVFVELEIPGLDALESGKWRMESGNPAAPGVR
jgi:succinyl-CoA synthetase beta subunit